MSPPDPESDEMTCLRAMQHAIYSLFVVESVERGLGATVRDLLSDEISLVVDMGIGKSAQPGMVFASRLLLQDGFSMATGAVLPVGVLPAGQQEAVTKELLAAVVPGDDGYFDPAPLIHMCLSRGYSSDIEYQDPTGEVAGQQQFSGSSRSSRVGRNERCPCGSGKKFKKCCMKHDAF